MSVANENLAAAQDLRRDGHYRSAVSRAYYAAFSAAHAIALRNGDAPPVDPGTGVRRANWSHDSIVNLYAGHIGRDKEPSKKVQRLRGRSLARLFSDRLRADYQPRATIDEEVTIGAMSSAKGIVEYVRRRVTGGKV